MLVMQNNTSTTGMKKNVVLTVSAQLVSFFVSAVLNLILPKYVSEIDYSNWQTFLLYLGYVPIFHFGFLDGLMLRYSQYDYKNLNKPLVQSQFRLFLGVEVLFGLIGFALSFGVENETYRQIVRFISLGIITMNVYAYASHLFQMTNRISKYVVFVMMMRLILGVGVIAALFCGANSFYQLCVVYFAACILTILWGVSQNKELFWGKGKLADGPVAVDRPEARWVHRHFLVWIGTPALLQRLEASVPRFAPLRNHPAGTGDVLRALGDAGMHEPPAWR